MLKTYPDLKKEDWFIGMEGGDDIWSFNVIGSPPVLDLLAEKMKDLRRLFREFQ
ncbi:hypothetical protein [Pedobacter steynii]|uniref:hypothetical protein n=1 Tax=Pedobacter steynii TaxID=430522 RepID=UPI0012FBA06F|nr:hypothetical protein [Pedobacter steynii]